MKNLIHLFFLIFLISISISITPNAFADKENMMLSHFYAKTIVVSDDDYTKQVFWMLIHGDVGTIVSSTSNGVIIMRINLYDRDQCEDLENIVCLEAKVLESNEQNVHVGDSMKITFDMPHKVTVKISDGILHAEEFDLEILKLITKPETTILKKSLEKDTMHPKSLNTQIVNMAIQVSRSPLLQYDLIESNNFFNGLNDSHQILIEEREKEWVFAKPDTITNLMKTISDRSTSKLFSTAVENSKDSGTGILEEIILTNAHGVNVAMSQRTTDYDQSDEEWWILAKNRGVYLGTPEFDESVGAQTWSIAIRITDYDDKFMGVMKFVLNFNN